MYVPKSGQPTTCWTCGDIGLLLITEVPLNPIGWTTSITLDIRDGMIHTVPIYAILRLDMACWDLTDHLDQCSDPEVEREKKRSKYVHYPGGVVLVCHWQRHWQDNRHRVGY